jgi:hypothetical protein
MSSFRYLVGAPHSLSNIRPVIYNGRLPGKLAGKNGTIHPYSLEEFTPSVSLAGDARREAWDAERQSLDVMNHRFWSNVGKLVRTILNPYFTL